MKITGTTRVCGLLGYPVSHTFSPAIHNYLAEALHLDLVYEAFALKPEELEAGVKGGFALHMLGFNVTVPHKQTIMPYLTGIEEGANAIGAVNTLVREEAGFRGYNTDYLGLQRLFQKRNIDLKGKTAVILGAGGAAAAAAYVCGVEGASKVYILNRTKEKSLALQEKMTPCFSNTVFCGLGPEQWQTIPGDQWIGIQTTSVGLHPHVEETPMDDRAFYKKLAVAVDVIYNPETTKFMQLASEAGAQSVNGMDMLLYQALASFELWTGQNVPDELVAGAEQVLREKLDESKQQKENQ